MLTLKEKTAKAFFLVLAMLLSIAGFDGKPQSFEFAIWMFGLAFTASLRKFFLNFPPLKTFFFIGLILGLLTESFSIVGSLSIPIGERVLLGQTPMNDLLFGLFYYGLLMWVWTLLIRRYPYTPKEVFFLTGILGVLTEEVGGVFMRLLTDPLANTPYTLIVICVYGIFPFLAAHLTYGRIMPLYPGTGRMKRYFLAAVGMFLFIAVFGNFLLPLLREIFGA